MNKVEGEGVSGSVATEFEAVLEVVNDSHAGFRGNAESSANVSERPLFYLLVEVFFVAEKNLFCAFGF